MISLKKKKGKRLDFLFYLIYLICYCDFFYFGINCVYFRCRNRSIRVN